MLLDAAVMRQRGRFRADRRRRPAMADARRRARRRAARAARRAAAAAAARRATARCSSTSTARCSSSRRRPTRVRVDGEIAALLPALARALGGARRADHRPRDRRRRPPVSRARAAGRRPARLRAARRRRHDPPARAAAPRTRAAARASSRASPRATTGCCSRTRARRSRCTTGSAPRLASHVHRTLRAQLAIARGGAHGGCSQARAPRDQPGRPRQGHGDRRLHGRAAVRRPPAGVRRRRPAPTSTASPRSTRLGGWAVKVGAGPTRARYRLPDVAAVRALARGAAVARRRRRDGDRLMRNLDLALIGNGAHRPARRRARRDRLGLLSALRRRPDVLRAARRRAARRRARHLRDRARRLRARRAGVRRRTPRCSSRGSSTTRGGAIEITDCVPRFVQHGRMFHPMTLVRRDPPHRRQPAHRRPAAARRATTAARGPRSPSAAATSAT